MNKKNGYDFDLSFLFEFTEGDKAQMLHYIQKFIDNYPKEIAEVEKACHSKDRQGFYRAVHSFRPQLQFVGLKTAAAQLLEIEHGARDGMDFEQMADVFGDVKNQFNKLPQAKEWMH